MLSLIVLRCKTGGDMKHNECDLRKGMPFHCKIIELKTNLKQVEELLIKAYDVLSGDIPDNGKNCEYCKWTNETSNI